MMKRTDTNDGVVVGDNDFFDEYGFDFKLERDILFDGLSTLSRVISSDGSTDLQSEETTVVLERKSKKVEVNKASLKRVGSKVQACAPMMKRYFSEEGGVSFESLNFDLATDNGSSKPRMKLYVYPTFDRSDSSLFLPSKLARHLNSGNMSSVSTLIRLNFDKNCKFDMDLIRCNDLTPRHLFKFYNLFQERHVDSIRCVRQTTITENQIHSVIFLKFTSNLERDAFVRRNVRDPDVRHMLACEHQCLLRNPFRPEDYSAEEHHRLSMIYHTPGDKEIYVTQEMTLTMDPHSKKVTHFKTVHRVTSMALAPPPLPEYVI